MLTRLYGYTRFGLSMGLTLLLGVSFVPMGCSGEGAYTVVPSASSSPGDSRELPDAVVAQLTACAKQGRAGPTQGEPPTYWVEFDLEANDEGNVDGVTLTHSTLDDRDVETCMAGVLRGMTLPVRQMERDRDKRGPIQPLSPDARSLDGFAGALQGGLIVLIPVAIVGTGLYIVMSSRVKTAAKTKGATRKYPNQTCEDNELEALEAEKKTLCNSGYAATCTGDKKIPKHRDRLDNTPCSAIVISLAQRYKCINMRKLIQERCFGGVPDLGHQEAIDDQQRGADACEALKLINCAVGHPMSLF